MGSIVFDFIERLELAVVYMKEKGIVFRLVFFRVIDYRICEKMSDSQSCVLRVRGARIDESIAQEASRRFI
eukprot:scaffold361_cov265-Chaetoceros_neogracile.AAC.17